MIIEDTAGAGSEGPLPSSPALDTRELATSIPRCHRRRSGVAALIPGASRTDFFAREALMSTIIVIRIGLAPLALAALVAASNPSLPRHALGPTESEELTIFDANGDATAYIVTDKDLTIYDWGGVPDGYLKSSSQDEREFSIYGFNGKHLGWLASGIVRDHDGRAVGFLKGALSGIMTKLEPLKGLKQLTPLRSLEELEPLQPLWSQEFSSTPLSLFLASGRD